MKRRKRIGTAMIVLSSSNYSCFHVINSNGGATFAFVNGNAASCKLWHLAATVSGDVIFSGKVVW